MKEEKLKTFSTFDLKLQEENEKLRNLLQCKICFEKESCIVFLPCSHMVCCEKCFVGIKKCPICRGLILGNVKTFRS